MIADYDTMKLLQITKKKVEIHDLTISGCRRLSFNNIAMGSTCKKGQDVLWRLSKWIESTKIIEGRLKMGGGENQGYNWIHHTTHM